jgi:Ribonuclease G/E
MPGKDYSKRKVKPEDYIYAVEVAGQPAVTAAEKAMKEKAQRDVRYLEREYPGIAKKFKLFGDRVQNTSPMKDSPKPTKRI